MSAARTERVTVTDLVLDTRPSASLPAPQGISLSVEALRPFPLDLYRHVYAEVGTPWFWVERARLTDNELAGMIHRPGISVSLLRAEGQPAGYFELDVASDDAELVYFGLVPAWSGRRIGPWLLSQAITRAFDSGATRLKVNTCTLDHPAALGLYKRLGFRVTGTRERDLSAPADWPTSSALPA